MRSPLPVPALLLALGAVLLAGVMLDAAPIRAQPTEADDSVSALRREADASSQAYFDALAQTQALQAQIAELEAKLPVLADRRADLLVTVRRRAAEAYKRSGVQLGALLDSDGALDAARRTQWLDRLAARDHESFRELRRVTAQIEVQRLELRTAEQKQQTVVSQLEAAGTDIDAKLQAAEDRQRALQAAATPPRTVAGPPAGSSPPAAPPPDYQPTPGEHPQHNDPFLVCTRARESGGNYQAYNAAGPYMGAYQFLQSTWNSAANRAGRAELIGVPPNTASAYDQDDIAWALYQTQGSGPWGGQCE